MRLLQNIKPSRSSACVLMLIIACSHSFRNSVTVSGPGTPDIIYGYLAAAAGGKAGLERTRLEL